MNGSWFEAMAADAAARTDVYLKLGFADLRLMVEETDGDACSRYGLILDGYDVIYAGEVADAAAFGAEATVSGARETWDEMVAKGYVVIGSPDTVRETLEDVARTFNCGHLLTMLQFGNMSDELTRYNSELFGDKVAPALRPMFSEFDAHWWRTNATVA